MAGLKLAEGLAAQPAEVPLGSNAYRRDGQQGGNLVGQRTKLSFQARVFIQQISEPARPPLRLRVLGLLQRQSCSRGELVMSLGQPLPGDLSLAHITTADQPGEPAPHRFPHISDRRSRHRLTRELRQSHQDITRHTATPPWHLDLAHQVPARARHGKYMASDPGVILRLALRQVGGILALR